MNKDYTFDELMNWKKIQNEATEKITAELRDLTTKAAELNRAMLAATDLDDTEAYVDAEAKYNAIMAQIRRKRNNLLFPAVFSRENVKAAWSEYAKDYNKKFDKRFEEYAKAREALAARYVDLVKAQAQALGARRTFNALLATDPRVRDSLMYNDAEYFLSPELEELHYLPNRSTATVTGGRATAIDVAYFIKTGTLPKSAFAGLALTVDSHVPTAVDLDTDNSFDQTKAFFGLYIP